MKPLPHGHLTLNSVPLVSELKIFNCILLRSQLYSSHLMQLNQLLLQSSLPFLYILRFKYYVHFKKNIDRRSPYFK